ncbi:unnamed protein product [Mytilus edulis]|uniref:Reverse transcriptase domain-containing protein n=1 Tax=Mytilus edulis TaxID=6550 RepID=A0A8S3UFH5_MYTED|nr:unnamed protein product [Mytilus edulis]
MILIHRDMQAVKTLNEKVHVHRIKWNKMDTSEYEKLVDIEMKKKINESETLTVNNINSFMSSICNTIVSTAEKLQPRKNKSVKRKREWTPQMSNLAKDANFYHWKWKMEDNKNRNSENYRKMRSIKKNLRSVQRRHEANKRQNKMAEIMTLSETNDKQFYTLVKHQRRQGSSSTSVLKYNDNVADCDEDILETWADYFEDLATPVNNPCFDNEYKTRVENDNCLLHEIYSTNRDPLQMVNEDEVSDCILSFKNGKSPDETRVTSEHLKHGGQNLISILTILVNFIFQNIHIPTVLKNGIACPIFKSGGKPIDNPNSYRKITVTNPIGKMIEKLHLSRNSKTISKIQSILQKGFTEGECPAIAGLILTELFIEAIENNRNIFFALTDAQKAFDIVWHDGLFREMFKCNIVGDNWLLFKEWYNNVQTKIKWQGQFSHTFPELQGVRQGGVWSPAAYKIFINSLLKIYETEQLGARIGSVYCGVPTVADDVTLVSNDPFELQSMLDIQMFHANKQRYIISSQNHVFFKEKTRNSQLEYQWSNSKNSGYSNSSEN